MKKYRLVLMLFFISECAFITYTFAEGVLRDPSSIFSIILPLSFDSIPIILLLLLIPLSLFAAFVNYKLSFKKEKTISITDNMITNSTNEISANNNKYPYLFHAIIQLSLVLFAIYEQLKHDSDYPLGLIFFMTVLSVLSFIIIIDYQNGALED